MSKLLALLLFPFVLQAQVIVTLPSGLTPVAAPTFSPVAGSYGAAQSVVISDTQNPATIIYTFDGSVPTLSNGTQCAAPCTVSVVSSLTINALATAAGFGFSTMASAAYVLSISPTGTPTFSPSPGTFSIAPVVTISDLSPGAVIYYTLDNSTPTTASSVYSTPLTLNTVGSTPLKAIAKASSLAQSGVQSGVFIYQPAAATPVISPSAGTYVSSVSVTITDSCPSATIRYTTNGITPTGASPIYGGAIVLSASANVQAIATCPLYAQSAVASTQYTITIPAPAPTPTFSPAGGSYTGTQTVSITDTAPGAVIYYCTAPCSPPTASTVYTTPITVSSTETINALATAPGFAQSAQGQATYTIGGAVLACPQTSGGLTANITQPRVAAVSPFFVFYDATGTTSSNIAANTTTFQDVTYTWSFGDSGASGSGTWAYGSNPNANSTNSATGGMAGHLYIITPGGGDKTFTATVKAQDGVNTVTCSAPSVTVYDPQGTAVANGGHAYGGAATTCVAATSTPVAGVGGCPPGAGVLQSASFVTVLASKLGSGKRVLFNCGDTFTGSSATLSGTNLSVGAYGGCEGTQSNRPIFGGGINIGTALNDGRIADIDFESAGAYAVTQNGTNGGVSPGPLTLYNLNSSGNTASYTPGWMHQYALIGSTMTSAATTTVSNWLNYAGNECLNSSTAFNCGNGGSTWVQSNYIDNDYQAVIGDSLNSNNSSTYEVLRVAACRKCIIADSDFLNAGPSYAVLKLHNGNTYQSAVPWTGQYTEFVEISDNLFGGSSGAQLVEEAPQNAQNDERLQNIVNERNVFAPAGGSPKCVAASGINFTFRDNAFYQCGDSLAEARRGLEWNATAGSPQNANEPEYFENFNNTCVSSSTCVGLNANQGGWGQPAQNSWAQNILAYNSGGGSVVSTSGNAGTQYAVSNNSTSATANPGFTNESGTFSRVPDFTPTANYSGGTSVPNLYDALLQPWNGSWDLGAVNHSPVPVIPIKTQVKFSGCTFAGIIGTGTVGQEATGTDSNGTQLTLFNNYVDLIGRSHCKYIGRAIDLFDWEPDFTAIGNNITAFNSRIGDTSHLFGEYVAEKVPLNGPAYFSTTYGRNFIFANMCNTAPAPGDTDCKDSYNQPEYVTYVNEVMTSSINLGIQVFYFGEVGNTDGNATLANSKLLALINTMRSYAATKGQQLLAIAQFPATAGGSSYLNGFDLIQGAVYMNADGTVPTTANGAATPTKGSTPPRLWLATNGSGNLIYNLQNLIIEFDWFSNPVDDSSEFACLDIPNTTQGQTYLTAMKGLSASNCPLGSTTVGTGLSVAQSIYTMFSNLGVGFWLPGRQTLAFTPGKYTPLNLLLNTGEPASQQINWNDEGILLIGNP